MRIELTVRHEGREQDIAITSTAPLPWHELRAELAHVTGVRPDAPVWSGADPLPVSAVLGGEGLRCGALLSTGGPHRAVPQPGGLALHQVGGPGAGRVLPLGRGRLVVGRGTECDLVLADADVSRRHAVLEITGDGVLLRDLGSTNGTTIDGEPASIEGRSIAPGELVRVGDCALMVAGPTHIPAATSPAGDGTLRVLRPPRIRPAPHDRVIELPVRGEHQRPRAVQWVAALLPAVAGGALAWFAHSPQFLLFVLLSPLMILSTSLGDRLHWRRSRRHAAAEFARRSAETAAEIDTSLRAETSARRVLAPDAADLIRLAVLPGSRLWERRRADPDFLTLRLGVADRPSWLRVRDGTAERAAGTVPWVPIGADLRDGPLGIAAPARVRAGIARWLVGQLACTHSPADAGLCLLLAADEPDWSWTRWLPHLQGRVAVGREDCASLVADLTTLVDERLADRRVGAEVWTGPWHVLVIDGTAALAEVAGLTALLARSAAAGVAAICLDADPSALPTGCHTVARACGDTGSRAVVHDRDHAGDGLVLDLVDHEWAATIARCLASLTDTGIDGSAALPASCGLLETLQIAAPRTGIDPSELARRWAHSAGGARTVIGAGPDGALTLDLVADGPHALIAGTTGAGKSELLQTLVAGLAADQSPADLAVLLVDYKGGAAFGDCARLPHTAGLVTDLDGQLTARALRSLHSELRRRERILAAAGAADLAAYRAARGPGGALPRLVIVVDEFATLVEELPDFVRGLIGVAQRGRSLGLHLILATQRPSSAVSPEIRANTSLRIALRVTDAADSTDVIDAPVAATIERGVPGRGYLRSGAGLTGFQAAYGGQVVIPDSGVGVTPLRRWRRPADLLPTGDERTELTDLVDAIDKAALVCGFAPARSPWLPPLPEMLSIAELGASEHRVDDRPSPGGIVIGLVDRPDDQRRDSFSIDIERGGSLLVAGAARSGRTTTLATVALVAAGRFGPDELSVHVIDASGSLAEQLRPLPHCASVLGPDDSTTAPALLRRLVDSVPRGAPGPRCLLLVDGWDALVAALGDMDAAECADLIAAVHRTDAVSVVVAGDRSVLAPRFAAGFGSRLLLRMADRNDFAIVGIPVRDVPDDLVPGRGVRSDDGALVQIAHAGGQASAQAAADEAASIALVWRRRGRAAHPAAVRIRPLPRSITLATVAELAASPSAGAGAPSPAAGLVLGVGGDDARVLRADLFRGVGRLVVAGPPRSGRSTVLRSLLVQARRFGITLAVAAPTRSPLRAAADACGIAAITPGGDQAAVGPPPDQPTLLLVDDVETFGDGSPAGDALTEWVRRSDLPLAVVVAGRADDLATTYRGLGASVRRANTAILLRPGPVDGEIVGVRLPRRPSTGPPGRGVLVADPDWGPDFAIGDPLPIQVALP